MIRRMRECQSGVALIEFAITLPIFLFAVMGGMELAWEAITRQRIQKRYQTNPWAAPHLPTEETNENPKNPTNPKMNETSKTEKIPILDISKP